MYRVEMSYDCTIMSKEHKGGRFDTYIMVNLER
jgi:hypothetical protein